MEPFSPAKAQNLALAQRKADIVEPGPGQAPDDQLFLANQSCLVGESAVQILPDDQGHDTVFVQRPGVISALALPIAQHGQPVGNRLHFADAVRVIDHRCALGRDLADAQEQALHVIGHQMLGRLVQNQHAGLAGQRLDDRDDEALFGVQCGHMVAHVDGNVITPAGDLTGGPWDQV